MQTTCVAMDAFAAKLDKLDEFSRDPVVMTAAEEARVFVKCIAAAQEVSCVGGRRAAGLVLVGSSSRSS